MTLVVFTEEPSMEAAMNEILPRIGVHDFTIIAHEGVSDLEKSLPRKLKAWRDPRARFLVLRDNDGGDCRERKARLLRIAKQAGKSDRTKVRIVCQELEAWFIGDARAVEAAGIGRISQRHDDPDQVARPSAILKRICREYQKTSGARAIAEHLDLADPRSASLRTTISAIRQLVSFQQEGPLPSRSG